MNKIINSHLFKYALISIAFIVALYFIVDINREVSVFVFTVLGAWKVGEWFSSFAFKLAKKWHGGTDD